MKKLAWGDTLCGHKVEPEGWALVDGKEPAKGQGGIVMSIVGDWYSARKRDKPIPWDKKFPWFMDREAGGMRHRNGEYPGYKTSSDQIPPNTFSYEPIYPPRRWKGLSEEKIWTGMQDYEPEEGEEPCPEIEDLTVATLHQIGDFRDYYVKVIFSCGTVWLHGFSGTLFPADISAHIHALSNAQVLSERLKCDT